MTLSIRLEREDDIPAFAGFVACEPPSPGNHVILMNVTGIMAPNLEAEDGELIPQTVEDRKRLFITTLMHEFGHALEAEFRLPVNEEAIEKACEQWDSQWNLYDSKT